MQSIFKVARNIVLLEYFMLNNFSFISTSIKCFHLFSENTIVTIDMLNSLYVQNVTKAAKNIL